MSVVINASSQSKSEIISLSRFINLLGIHDLNNSFSNGCHQKSGLRRWPSTSKNYSDPVFNGDHLLGDSLDRNLPVSARASQSCLFDMHANHPILANFFGIFAGRRQREWIHQHLSIHTWLVARF